MYTQLSRKVLHKPERPVRIIQYGEGNFLRAFADYFFQIINDRTDFNGSIEIIKPRAGKVNESFVKQDSMYTVKLRGFKNGSAEEITSNIDVINEVISPYSEYDKYISFAASDELQVIISNTTEAGIIYYDSDTLSMQPPESFPAKLTQFLYKRYTHFNGDLEKGLIILSCELIDSNGDRLKEIVFQLADDIPQGHKFSLCRLNPGDDIIKYKEDSGGFMLSS